MAVRGKSINLFLMDGTASGRVKCTLANWTGLAYKIPRTDLEKCRNRADLKQSGVYFLFGVSDVTGDKMVYVGQAGTRKNGEGVLYRLQEHKRAMAEDYWTEAVVFTTSNHSFGPTEISYLENRFFNLAVEANRYQVRNNLDPTSGHTTEEKESELEEFIDYAKIVMGTLGYPVFMPLEETVSIQEEKKTVVEPLLYLKGRQVDATGRRVPEGFIVYKDSIVRELATKSCPRHIQNLRKQYQDRLENQRLTADTLFTSPSAAAGFVRYASMNGLTEWKDDKGRSLKEIENEE
ncbi:MAG: GIY-YIG nuclease family protein [Aerococcus sp.]|nr:GIY-YIG nuclease family protein [Aerococcus sp.]